MSLPPRVLLISYPFPPVGGAGVQRVTKFAKYLPAAGWATSVLTVANPSVPLTDHSLAGDIPEGTIVRRARTWEPSYALKSAVANGSPVSQRSRASLATFTKGLARRAATFVLQPDAQVLWAPAAIREGLRLLHETPHAAIVATGPPFSTFLIAARLSLRTGLPLVLDYRDEWGLSNAVWENKRLGSASRRIQSGMQRQVVRQARALIATTQASARSLEHIRDEAKGTARVECIYNGFDPDDFPDEFVAAAPPPPGTYRLVYAGTLWNLTSVAPLVDAVVELARHRPDLAARLELVFAGRRTGPQQEQLQRLRETPCRLVEHAYLDHVTAIDLIRSANGLCVLLTETPGAERVVPAKLFESLAARRPILAIAPRGEVWDLLANYPAAYPLEPQNITGIVDVLAHQIDQACRDDQVLDFRRWDSSLFNRKNQAEQLARLLSEIYSPPRAQ